MSRSYQTTPGVDYLARQLTYPLILCLLWFLLVPASTVPVWIVVSVSLLFIPFQFFAHVVFLEYRHKREARQLGARWILGYGIMGIQGTGFGSCCKTWASFNFRAIYIDSIFTISPEYIKIILATDFDNYVKGAEFHEAMVDVLGTGVFNSDGDMWKCVRWTLFHRTMTRPFFNRDRMNFEMFDRHIETTIGLIKERMREGVAVDFQDVMYRFTIDAASEFLFGASVDCLSSGCLPYPYNHASSMRAPDATSPGSQPADKFSSSFLQAQHIIASRVLVGGYLDPIVERAVRRSEERKIAGEHTEGETLLDHLVQQTDDTSILKDEILNILIAGRTQYVTVTLTFALYLLALHPSALAPYAEKFWTSIEAVINETLRLFPPPIQCQRMREINNWPSPEPGGKPIYIPAGAKTSYSVLMMHRRKDLWGPDAEEFDPDRFIDDRLKKYLVPNPFIFLPFNAGPRICLGQQFAYNEISLVLIRLLQSFSSISLETQAMAPAARPPAEWREAGGRKGAEQFRPKVHLTMYCEGGMWLKFGEAT
ncbi:cytochrome P450 [Infundibulicybe gibba]|nr:cytochrome P450 [Infundibulicybe gibba]